LDFHNNVVIGQWIYFILTHTVAEVNTSSPTLALWRWHSDDLDIQQSFNYRDC